MSDINTMRVWIPRYKYKEYIKNEISKKLTDYQLIALNLLIFTKFMI